MPHQSTESPDQAGPGAARSGAASSPVRSDRELVAACLAGDDDAWSELVQRYERLVYSVPRRYGLDPMSCDDIFQTVFEVLVRRLPHLRQPEALPQWLITTASRLTWRKAGREKRLAARSEGLESLPHAAPEALRCVQDEQQVRDALRQLGGPCEALLSALYGDAGTSSYESVAARLGLPLGSIGPTRARCLTKLLEVLEREG